MAVVRVCSQGRLQSTTACNDLRSTITDVEKCSRVTRRRLLICDDGRLTLGKNDIGSVEVAECVLPDFELIPRHQLAPAISVTVIIVLPRGPNELLLSCNDLFTAHTLTVRVPTTSRYRTAETSPAQESS